MFKLESLPPERVHELVAAFERVIAANLSHPAIAQPIATGMTGASAFLATDYVAADSLDHAVREFGPSPPADALQSATSLAAALDQAAAVNIAHGCLHPRDVLLSSQETRLTGLGVAQALEQVGVPVPVRRPYTAPERITGSHWHRRADVFSLAALVHEMLWGRRITAAGEQAADALTPVDGADLAALKRAFARALARDPADRYADATDFVDAIRQAMPEAAAAMAPPSTTRKLRLAVNRAAHTQPDPAAVLQQPRFADLDAEADPASVSRGPSILSFVDDRDEADHEARPPLDIEHATDEPAAPAIEPVAEPPRLVSEEPPLLGGAEIDRSDIDVPISEPPFVEPSVPPALVAPPPVAPHEPPPAPSAAAALAADETHAPAHREVPPPDLSILERSRSAVWPLVLAMIIGVVLGFAGGYAVGLRDRPEPAASTAAAAPTPRGREFTEGTVAAEAPKPAPAKPAPAAPAPKAPPALKPPTVPAIAPPRPEPRAPRPQPEATGRLLVRSTPAGARVLVDDRDAGRTPASVGNLAIGAHRVKIVQDGYTTEDRRVVITRARPVLSMAVTLARVKPPVSATRPQRLQPGTPVTTVGRGALTVESRPAGARVFLDGKPVGTTPMSSIEVPAGDHTIRLEHDGYRHWAGSVRVTASEHSRVTASLER